MIEKENEKKLATFNNIVDKVVRREWYCDDDLYIKHMQKYLLEARFTALLDEGFSPDSEFLYLLTIYSNCIRNVIEIYYQVNKELNILDPSQVRGRIESLVKDIQEDLEQLELSQIL